MAYLALYRKYRPQTFEQVYGQKAVIQTLKNAFKQNKIGHAYLFCGPRGTGKTSMARLFAKALNCEEGLGCQCGKCESCRAIVEGSHPDVIEMDAASNSSVDDVRNIISQVDYRPIMGRYRVYIIDEVHNMSASAFNALLKTLEEPPEEVVFILCTTEPQKVLPTILSRVQRFDFSRVSDQDLIADMISICQAEKVEAEPAALAKIASLADGGVRDALSLLDQAVSFSGERITLQAVEELFGLVDPASLCRLLLLARAGQVSDLVKEARALCARGMDISRATREMAGICRDLLILRAGGDLSMLNTMTPENVETLKDFTVAECNRFLTILIRGQREYRNSVDIGDAFEILLLQLAAGTSLETPAPAMAAPAVATPAPSTARPAPQPVERAKPTIAISTEPVSEAPKAIPAQKVEVASKPEPVATPAAAPTPTPAPAPTPTVKPRNSHHYVIAASDILRVMANGDKHIRQTLTQDWSKLPKGEGRTLVDTLADGVPAVCSNHVLLVKMRQKFRCDKLNHPESREELSSIIKSTFGYDLDVGAITDDEYNGALEAFKAAAAGGTLPKKEDFWLYRQKASSASEETASQPAAKISSAQEFVDALNGGK